MARSIAAAAERFQLGLWPTPLHRLDRLSAELGVEIWLKRDDLSGLATGGNKVRKLEFLIGAARAARADCVVTGGAAQSNHSRQTAAAAARAGLECHLALAGGPPDAMQGNLLLDELCGAQVHWCGPSRKGERIPEILDGLRRQGRRPWEIPYGGSDPVGSLGFVAAAHELREQCEALALDPAEIVFASSSGGTHAGLLVGTAEAGMRARPVGILIDPADLGNAGERIAALCRACGLDEPEVVLDDRALSGDYGQLTERDAWSIRRLARCEGVLLDPVYTGRAFAGLLDRIAEGVTTGPVVFWHTGGLPALFLPDHATRLANSSV